MDMGTVDVRTRKSVNFCLFVKMFEDLHKEAAQCYLQNQTKEFYECFRKILLQQVNILEKKP